MTCSSQKQIFVGAESLDFKNREQTIKGVIVHELCHYALSLVFENKENPYYEFDDEKTKEFEQIVTAYRKYEETQLDLDDGCGGILSNVYQKYKEDEKHCELIVIAPQIQVEFDDNKEEIKKLESKYELLFKFMENHVMHEMERFNLKSRNDVRNFNNISTIFLEIKNLSQNIKILKNANNFNGKNYVIVQTNVQKLFLLNSFVNLQEKYKSLLNARNIFTSTDILEKSSNFDQLLLRTKPLYVFINCTSQPKLNFKNLQKKKISTFIFVVKCKSDFEKVKEFLQQEGITADEISENFTWNDLSYESQNYLVQSKVLFQECTSLSLVDIIPVSMKTQEQPLTKNIFEELIDDDLLNLLIERQEIKLNSRITDQSINKNFKFLFQPRKFLRIQKNMKSQLPNDNTISILTHEQLLESVKNEKFVVISDIAGTGKSWQLIKTGEILRNIYPKKWTSYIDLKQCIRAFKSFENNQDFELFLINHILKPENEFESKIFKTLYESGNVIILFDGLDEIAPDYIEFVHKLIKSFKFNNGNQLWIATRDYFENELKEKLKINTVYKLDKFTQEENNFMLATNWLLHDFEKNLDDIPENNFLKWIENSPNYQSYQKTAQDLTAKILFSDDQSIGSPLFYKMTADIFKDDKNQIVKVTVPEVYKKFIKIQFLRWSKEKGEIRENASVEQNINNTLSHREIHQLFAMISLFPECSEFCDLDIIDCNWKVDEIVACGIVSIKDEIYYFPHETFREYYAADFIVRVICGKKPDIINLCKYLIMFLTIKKYRVIRMFLNEAISDDTVDKKIIQHMPKISKEFYTNIDLLNNLSNIFEENLEHLGKFLINLFKVGKYEDVKVIFTNNKGIINLIFENSTMFAHFKDLFVNNLNVDNTKNFILEFKIYQKLASLAINEDDAKKFILDIETKTGSTFSKEALKVQNEFDDNILFCLVQSKISSISKIKSFFELLLSSMCDNDLIELMKQRNYKGWNILHAVIDSNDIEKLDYLWHELKTFMDSRNLKHMFKDLCIQKSSDQNNILHFSASSLNPNFHEIFWNHLLQENILTLEELSQLIIQKDQKSINFVHSLVMMSNPCIIEKVFEILKNNLNEIQYLEILNSKGVEEKNLLHIAACSSKDIRTHKFLWKIFKDSCKSTDEFLKILEQTDENDNNIFNIAASFITKEILEFMDEELQKIASNDKIKELMCNLNIFMTNMCQLAAHNNKSLEFFEMLWSIIWKRFNSSEILELITHANKLGNNFLIVTIAKNKKEVINFTWNIILKFLKERFSLTEEEKFKIGLCDNIIKDVLPSNNIKEDEKELLKLNWLGNIKTFNLFGKYYQLNEKISIKTLISFTTNQNLESHKELWQHLDKTFTDRSKLMEFLTEKDKFIITLVKAQKLEIIEYTFEMLKRILNESQYYEIVRSRGSFNRYLFQRTAVLSKDQKFYQYLWKLFKDTYDSNEEFLSILQKGDDTNNNILNLSAAYGSKENFEFIVTEIETLFKFDEIKKMFSQLSIWNQNILQLAVKRNRSIDVHKLLWEKIHKYFDSSEILQFVKHIEAHSKNLILVALELNGKDVINFYWQETLKILQNYDSGLNEQFTKNLNQCDTIIKNFFQSGEIKEDEKEILELKWIENKYSCLFEYALVDERKFSVKSINDLMLFMSDNNIKNHEILWNHLLTKVESHGKLKNLLAIKSRDELYLHLLITFNNLNVIKKTFQILKEHLNDSQFQEILKLQGNQKRNLFHRSILVKKPKVVEFLWKTYLSVCKSSSEFLDIILETDEDGNNIFNLAACYATPEILNFLNEESEKTFLRQEVIKIMTNLNFQKQNLLQLACMNNKFSELNEIIWKIIDKNFNNLEKIEFIKSCDKDGFHILSTAIYYGNKEVVFLTWSKILNVLSEKDDQIQYLSHKTTKNENIFQLALQNKLKDGFVIDFVKNLIQKYELEL